ncbi:MAG: RsmE family RNA methyltransferase [Phycisphaera sp.]|nr:RsmE family RNA methyltransferase [Phycisphaera sp.]
MRRFYYPDLAGIAQDFMTPLVLNGDESHHALKVLRVKVGDRVELFDGSGTSAAGEVVETSRKQVTVRLTTSRTTPPLVPSLDIAVSLPKGPRAADMVNTLTQLGADRLFPLSTRHSTVKAGDIKVDRLQRAAIEAAKQSRRDYLLTIESPTTLENLFEAPHDLRLVAHPYPDQPFEIQAALGGASRVLALVGPEAGFTDEELALCFHHGCRPWKLSPNILRIETAAAAAVAILRAHTHNVR